MRCTPTILPSSLHSPSCAAQILTSPPKPALAALRPVALVARWWHPRGWAWGRVCVRGKEGGVVEWIFRVEEPEAERRWVRVVAREKMSVG